jgi:hypothetical protein
MYAVKHSAICDSNLFFVTKPALTCISRDQSLVSTRSNTLIELPGKIGQNISVIAEINTHGVIAFDLVDGAFNAKMTATFLLDISISSTRNI